MGAVGPPQTLDEAFGLAGGVDKCFVEDFLFLVDIRRMRRAGPNTSSLSSGMINIENKNT